MMRIIFVAAYIVSVVIFVYGISTLPQQNTNGTQKTAEEVNADYRQLLLDSASFKLMLGGVSSIVFLLIVHVVYRSCCYRHVEPESPTVRRSVPPATAKAVQLPTATAIPDVEVRPSILKKPLGPHITHLPINRTLV